MPDGIKAHVAAVFGASVDGDHRGFSQFGIPYEVQRIYLPCTDVIKPTDREIAVAFLVALANEYADALARKEFAIVWRRDPEVEWIPHRRAIPASESFSGDALPDRPAGLYGSMRFHLLPMGSLHA